MAARRKGTAQTRVKRFAGSRVRERNDVVSVEEPMEIRLEVVRGGRATEHSVSITMRTPGDDFDLAAGFLFGEGLIGGRDAISDLRYCQSVDPQEYNIVSVRLRDPDSFDPADLNRNFSMTSSCGVCGKASLEAVELSGCRPLPDGSFSVRPDVLAAAPGILRAAQPMFGKTGGLHAAALLDADGTLGTLREDVGRHNAVDKVVGRALLENRLPLSDSLLAVSGRASFEILQKALTAGIPLVVAVGAPSSLAVDVAREFNMSLVGFAKPEGFNVYAGSHRIVVAEGP